MNTLEAAVQAAFPLLAVPLHGALPPLQQCGIRYLVGRHGVSREIRLPWIELRELVAPSAIPLPYGVAEDRLQFRCGPLPEPVLQQCIDHAHQALPLETAGALLWHASDDHWRYLPRPIRGASASHVDYQEVRPDEGEHLVVDVHSHGCHPAFFSALDDGDDAGAMKLSLVLGELDQPLPSSRMRLSMAGIVRTAYLRPDGRLAVAL